MLKRFWENTSGNFSMMMAGSVLALMGGIGLSVDYLGMTQASANLQSAADGAVLAAALSGEDDQQRAILIGDEVVETFRVDGLDVTTEYEFTDDSIIVRAYASYTPQIMNVFGFGNRTISAMAEAPRGGGGSLDITLVLDVTDSMDFDGKLDAMKVAVNNFIDNFEVSDGDIRVSVVPFSQYVNVGTQYRNQTWIDNSEEGTTFPPVTDTDTDGSVCTGGIVEESCTRERDGVSYASTCNRCPGGWTGGVVTTTVVEPLREWDGCVGSRVGNKATEPQYGGTPFPAVYDDGRDGDYWHTDYDCPAALLPLTTDLAAVRDMVDDLNADGTTYMPSGLVWGWRLLDDDVPLGMPIAGETRKKALILMTDGHNTVSQLGSDKYHHGESDDDNSVTDDANAVTERICDNLKSTDILVYTIAYDLPMGADADDTKDLLSACSTEASNFFDASGGGNLNRAFEAIGADLIAVRLIN